MQSDCFFDKGGDDDTKCCDGIGPEGMRSISIS